MPDATPDPFEIFLACAPGLEPVLAEEAGLKGFRRPRPVPGGVTLLGGWPEVWRANLWLRGAGRVLARIETFHVEHLNQLAGRARRVPWARVLRADVPVRVAAVCSGSRIYHSGAAAERIEAAIAATTGAPIGDGGVEVRARIADDVCTLSVDTSGDPLHKRGWKQEVGPAPLRETLAALFLRQCGFSGDEPVIDPMCGAGTFVIEAAEIAAGLNPGRLRRFAFERLAGFDAETWARMRAVVRDRGGVARGFGQDRDAGAVAMSEANAERAGVGAHVAFRQAPISDAAPPDGPPGLVIANPPYGERLGDGRDLTTLYRAFGQIMRDRFGGWRVGLVTSDPALAHATALPFLPPGPPVPHGGVRVRLFHTAPLAATARRHSA